GEIIVSFPRHGGSVRQAATRRPRRGARTSLLIGWRPPGVVWVERSRFCPDASGGLEVHGGRDDFGKSGRVNHLGEHEIPTRGQRRQSSFEGPLAGPGGVQVGKRPWWGFAH